MGVGMLCQKRWNVSFRQGKHMGVLELRSMFLAFATDRGWHKARPD